MNWSEANATSQMIVGLEPEMRLGAAFSTASAAKAVVNW